MFGEKIRRTMPIAGLALLASLPAAAAPYRVISETTEQLNAVIGDLALTKTVVQDGDKAINRFTMHRLRRTGIAYRGAILLMPALGNNFNSYLSDETGDRAKSFAAYFARMGYDVWGYSPRETGIAAGQCGAVLDCSEALNWSMQTVVDDATYIRRQIRTVYGPRDPVIGGLSMGAASALAVVNARPNDYAGLLAWEGSLRTGVPALVDHAQNYCIQFNGAVAAGAAVDDQSLPFVKLVAQLAQTAPNDPFVIPSPLPPGLTNIQAFVFLLSVPNPVAPSPRPGFTSAMGNFPAGQFFFSDTKRLLANVRTFNDVTANRTTRDLYCSLSGAENAYTSNLANFTRPVMIISAGQGFGSIMNELPALLGGGPVTFQVMNNFGHVDHFGSANHLALLEIPVSTWLAGVF